MTPVDKLRTPLDKYEKRGSRGRARSTLIVLVLACATIITLDYRGGSDSPLDPARNAVGEALGPVEVATADAISARASCGVEGTTIFRPGVCAKYDSMLCECVGPARSRAPTGHRKVIGMALPVR